MARTTASIRKDELIIAALLSNSSLRAASAACGVCETQIRKRLKDPAFKEKYDSERRELLQQNTTVLQGHVSKAISTIAGVMSSKTSSEQTKLNAAEAIIRNSLKLTEQTEILERLDKLEKSLK